MTTIHAYTNDQRILDSPHKDLRRARAAATSMIPTTTGAAEAVGEVIPEMKGKLTGMAIRVPTPNVSVVDVVLETERQVTVESANNALKNSANGELREVLAYTEEPLVSKDFNGNPNSSIVDGLSTLVVGDNMLKVLAWYDNEWGFSCRVIDLIKYMTSN
jgi:glyceraldehyde 3-phosphate dehydrogenase